VRDGAELQLRFAELSRRVRAHLGQDRRYEHCVRVARCADLLAQRHGIDPAKARVAAMLHDLARLYSERRLIDECERRGLAIDEFERRNPIVLHARLGAALARELFGIDDGQVLSAIEKHTTAAAAMSPLDCVVYLADLLEPGRTFEGRERLWALAQRDLHEAMREAIAQTVRHLRAGARDAAPATAAAARTFGLNLEEVAASAI